MMFGIGSNLKRLRLQKGVTQEQLAEVFNISAQAVSRWENNLSYPDVTLLPGLAMYYGTSIDEIMGMEHIRKEDRLQAVLSDIYSLAHLGESEKSLALIRENLKIYPDNSSLLMALCETLARKTEEASALSEALSVSERILEKTDISLKARSTTMVNLLFLYIKAGMDEKAEGLVRQLPHIWECREMVMPELHDGMEYRQALKAAIRKALIFLCGKVEACEYRRKGETPEYVQLGVEFKKEESSAELLKMLEAFLKDQ